MLRADTKKTEFTAEEWRRVFNAINDPVFIKDRNHTILYANKAFSDVVKTKPKDIIGKKCHEVFHKSRKPWPNCPFAKSRINSVAHTAEVIDPNAGVPLLVTVSPVFDNKGKFIGNVHVAKDISEHKKTEKKLKETREELERKEKEIQKLDQLKSDFVSTVSHELRTPLSITKEGISLVLDKIPGPINEKQKKILTTAKDNIDRLANIINDLLDISKIEAGKVELKRTQCNIKSLIMEVKSLYEKTAEKKGLVLQVDIPDEDIVLYLDEDKMRQVFINLIGNALKFTRKGHIGISVRKFRDRIECSVLDTGKGISKDDLPRVFGKFQQFDRVAGPGEKGTGLGLSIVKGIIELHKGSIWVESEQGKGTVFTFTLPIYTSDMLFEECVQKGIEEAEKKNYKMSLCVINIAGFEKLKTKSTDKDKKTDILKYLEEALKKTLRREGDVVVKDATGEIIVLLANCNKENAMRVEGRLEHALEECLADHKLDKKIRLVFGCATYPDDAETGGNLIREARSA